MKNEGTPSGTVIAMAWAMLPLSTPRRMLALFSAKVTAARSAKKPPSTSAPRIHAAGAHMATRERRVQGRREKHGGADVPFNGAVRRRREPPEQDIRSGGEATAGCGRERPAARLDARLCARFGGCDHDR